MRATIGPFLLLATTFFTAAIASGQPVEMFPLGPYVAHCRAVQCQINWGGDDDNNNIYFFAVDPALADGTAAPDVHVHLWDGDNNATGSVSGTQDFDIYASAGHSVFEYRLYGGPGAATDDDAPSGQDPTSWTGTLIDIDSDPGDDTLRTDDPDDVDGLDPEDLRDQGFSIIAVDMDAHPGDLVAGLLVYKLVVDGTFGPGGEWNRYELQVTRDAARTDTTGIHLFVNELTYAGRPASGGVWTNLAFRVPHTVADELDIQTLDLDRDATGVHPRSTLGTPSAFHDDSSTYESDEQYVAGNWMWTSLNQPVAPPSGDGVTGVTYPVPPAEEGALWTLDVDLGSAQNPFSVRLADRDGQRLPMFFDPVFLRYGTGPIDLGGTGLPQAGGPAFTLEAAGAAADSPGFLFVSFSAAEVPFPEGVLYLGDPIVVTIALPFDATGAYTLPASLPPGTPGVDLYLQTFAVAPAVQHSNGLRMTVLP